MNIPPPLKHVRRVKKLYKTILKLHRGLPEELRNLGTSYAKDEFKRHKKCTPQESAIFISEWTVNLDKNLFFIKIEYHGIYIFILFYSQNYALTLGEQIGLKDMENSSPIIGKPLDDKVIDEFRDEQVVQLYELLMAATNKEDSAADKKQQ